ncbi:MAG: hypothetical protein GWP19_04005 [Planctomycetia bacterium]|nr:hypothetical protein [Planctomycetia bacterium]
MKYNDIIKLELTKDDVIAAIAKAKAHDFIDNLRDRHINIQFDSKLRGYIGEIALKNWFLENDIKITTTNYFDEDIGMDVDFEYKGLDLELKTSLIPDTDKTLQNVFNKRDIKLIRRTRKIEDLKSDIHIQIYYDQLTNKKDQWLQEQKIDINSSDLEYLYDALLVKIYLTKTYLVGWINKDTLIERINKLKGYEKSWRFARRRFWVCKLKDCYSPMTLIKYLNE